MPSWTERPVRTAPLVFFDLETTALRPDRGGRIREMAVVGPDGCRYDWTSPHDPPRDAVVAEQLSVVHSHLCEGIVVGHNLSFDLRFLTYEAERLGLRGLALQFADTLGLARQVRPGRDDYRLGALVDTFGVSPDAALHTAVGDALATRGLFWALVDAGALETLADVGVKRLRWNAG